MKIQCLELINFRNHSNTFMVFDKVNYIVGNNNQANYYGALQYAITGENEWAVKQTVKDPITYEKLLLVG